MKLLVISLFTVGLLALGGWIFFFNSKPSPPPTPEKKVAVTIYPLYDIVRNISGDQLEVVLILPPGASPHTFEPSPQDVQNLTGSETIFIISHGLDDWVGDLAQNAGVNRVDTVDTNIDLLTGEEDGAGANPHYWLSLINAQIMAQNVADILEQIDPDHAQQYQLNAQQFNQQLQALHTKTVQDLTQKNIHSIATFHNAWDYLARDYSVNVATTFEEYPGQEPSPVFIRDFQESIADNNITVVYAEPQFSDQKLETIAADIGVSIQTLDPLGGTIDKDTYINLMQYNLDTITTN